MLSEILKIKPQLDESDLRKMETTLNHRFRRIAKRFGSGIMSVVKGAGIAGLAISLIDKFLNPLKETKEAIERLLKSSDDIATNAKAFDTTTGKLFKLAQLAKASGLEQASLFQVLSKYQTVIGRARQNPNDPLAPAVKNYVNEKDLVDSFFGFIQSLRKLDQKDQAVVKSAVFGEDKAIQLNDFIQQDFTKLLKEIGLDKISSEKFTTSIEKLSSLSDLQDALRVGRESQDILKKSQIINESMIRAQDKQTEAELKRENQRVKAYKDLEAVTTASTQIMTLVEKGVQQAGTFITKVTPLVERIAIDVEKFTKSPFVRGVKGLFGGDD